MLKLAVMVFMAIGLVAAIHGFTPNPPGVVGDGRADDTEALQKAIDKTTGVIRLSAGTFRITRSLVVDLDRAGWRAITADGASRLLMDGPGPALRFVGTHEGTADPASVKPNVWQRQRMPTVEGLEILGGHPQAIGIQAQGTMQLTIARCNIRGCLHAIHLVGRNRNLLIADCHLYQNQGIGVYFDHVNLHQTNIVGCHISYCAGGGIVCRGGEVRNVHVGTCDIESNMAADAPATANILLDSTAGSVAEVAIAGCTLQHNSKSPDSANIRILGRGDGGKRLGMTNDGHVTISGNVLSDVRVNVHIAGARGVILTGNTFWMGYDHNLLVEESSNVVVGPNVFERNPRYDYGDSKETTNDLVFRQCRDCTLTGLHINGVYRAPAGLTLEDCSRFLVTGCTILDCDKIGLLARNLRHSRISHCLIRDDRGSLPRSVPMEIIGGQGNQIIRDPE
jgi:hypothetical protein